MCVPRCACVRAGRQRTRLGCVVSGQRTEPRESVSGVACVAVRPVSALTLTTTQLETKHVNTIKPRLGITYSHYLDTHALPGVPEKCVRQGVHTIMYFHTVL